MQVQACERKPPALRLQRRRPETGRLAKPAPHRL